MAAIVIADASPLIALARVSRIVWLQDLFGEVVVTTVVLREVLTGRFPESEATIETAFAAGWLKTVEVEMADPAMPDLDEGEAVFAQLHASDFRIASAVIHAVLDRCGESVKE